MKKNDCNISAFIQVRMNSKRLPGKALLKIDGLPSIERVVDSLRPSAFIKDIIIATTVEPEDDPIEKLASSKAIPFFRGDSENIVKRFLGASEKFNSDIIVRVTGDSPLINHEISDYLIDSHLKKKADYTAIEREEVPVGIYPEIISCTALKRLATYNMNFDYSEYLTFYFKNNPDVFSINIVPAPEEYRFPEYRLTLDYEEDLKMLNTLYAKLRKSKLRPTLPNVLRLLKSDPEISQLNSHLSVKYRSDKKLLRKITNATEIKRLDVDVGHP